MLRVHTPRPFNSSKGRDVSGRSLKFERRQSQLHFKTVHCLAIRLFAFTKQCVCGVHEIGNYLLTVKWKLRNQNLANLRTTHISLINGPHSSSFYLTDSKWRIQVNGEKFGKELSSVGNQTDQVRGKCTVRLIFYDACPAHEIK